MDERERDEILRSHIYVLEKNPPFQLGISFFLLLRYTPTLIVNKPDASLKIVNQVNKISNNNGIYTFLNV